MKKIARKPSDVKEICIKYGKNTFNVFHKPEKMEQQVMVNLLQNTIYNLVIKHDGINKRKKKKN